MSIHVPILKEPISQEALEAVLRVAAQNESDSEIWIVDATLGGGGHTKAMAVALKEGLASKSQASVNSKIKFLCVDQDQGAYARARENLEGINHQFVNAPISNLPEILSSVEGMGTSKRVAYVLADLGFSSDQIEDPERGLSFRLEGPLDMRLSQKRTTTAWELLNRLREEELVDIFSNFGEARFSKTIARGIVKARREGGLHNSTTKFASLVESSIPSKFRRGGRNFIHPATQIFQALRIAVNKELEELDALLAHVILNVSRGGAVAVLSFHSLEDRKVKQAFKDRVVWDPIDLITPDEKEISENPRARSAKLRIARKRV